MSNAALTEIDLPEHPRAQCVAGGGRVLDVDFGANKTVLIDDDVIHLPRPSSRSSWIFPRESSPASASSCET